MEPGKKNILDRPEKAYGVECSKWGPLPLANLDSRVCHDDGIFKIWVHELWNPMEGMGLETCPAAFSVYELMSYHEEYLESPIFRCCTAGHACVFTRVISAGSYLKVPRNQFVK